MTDDLRRQDDVMLGQFDKRLALLEQAHQNEAKLSDSRGRATERQIEALSVKIDGIATMWQSVTAEPTASPAGRTLASSIDALTIKVNAHESYIQQANGALRIAKFALGSSLVALVGMVVQLMSALAGRS